MFLFAGVVLLIVGIAIPYGYWMSDLGSQQLLIFNNLRALDFGARLES